MVGSVGNDRINRSKPASTIQIGRFFGQNYREIKKKSASSDSDKKLCYFLIFFYSPFWQYSSLCRQWRRQSRDAKLNWIWLKPGLFSSFTVDMVTDRNLYIGSSMNTLNCQEDLPYYILFVVAAIFSTCIFHQFRHIAKKNIHSSII